MGLSLFLEAMPAAARAVRQAIPVMRQVHSARGDLTYTDIRRVQQVLAEAGRAVGTALEEGMLQKEAAERQMAQMGGPETLEDFASRAAVIRQKAQAWHAALAAALLETQMEHPQLRLVVPSGEVTPQLEYVAYMPAAYADPLRQSAALAELVAAFEAAVA